MTTASPVLDLIRRVVEDRRLKELPDQELLCRFATGRDEAAFSALVRRHGSMVLGICRNMLANEDDAEDAFQATFLVLAQRAGAIRKKSSVGSWLHGVAYRTALKAQAVFARRQKHEAGVRSQPFATPSNDLTWREVQQALHAELSRLSECYRAPLVLCYLEGKTQDEAALLLSVSRATVKKRLESARALLGQRLARRGLGPAAVLTIAVWATTAAADPVSPVMVNSIIKAATSVAAGEAAASVVSAKVATLTEGVLKAMFPSKLTIASAVLAALVVIALSVSGVLHQKQAAAQPERPRAKEPVAQKEDRSKAESRPVVVREDAQIRTVAWSANGKILATIGTVYAEVDFGIVIGDDGAPTRRGGIFPHSTIKLWDATTGDLKQSLGEEKDTFIAAIAYSADGKSAAVSASKHILPKTPEAPVMFETEVRVLDVQTLALKHKVKGVSFASALAFSPDGTRLALGGRSRLAEDAAFVRLWDIQKQKLIGGTEGGGYRVHCLAFSSDGKQLAAGDENGGVRLFDGLTGAARRDFERHGPLRAGGEQCVTGVGFGPDGKTIVSGSMDKTVKLWDVETGKLRRALEGNKARVTAFAFSPDGQHFATAGDLKENDEARVEVLLWESKTWKAKRILPDQTMSVQSLAFSPDGSTLALGAGNHHTSEPDKEKDRLKSPGQFKLWKLGSPPAEMKEP
jgi:RNA polymerase sigma factor (sigma-70 family)